MTDQFPTPYELVPATRREYLVEAAKPEIRVDNANPEVGVVTLQKKHTRTKQKKERE
jgi:hypothetical protein